jgi:hypothetical protein
MASHRREFLGVLALAILLLPGCAFSFSGKNSRTPTTSTSDQLPKEGSTEFAVIPRVPGDTIALIEPKRTTPPPEPMSSPPIVPQPLTPLIPVVPAHSLPVDPPLVAAVRALIEGHPEAVAEHLRGLDVPNQEFLIPLLPSVVRAGQVNWNQLDPNEAASLTGQFDRAKLMLAKRASLTIDKAVFCRSVKNFGHYDPIPVADGESATFKPSDITILYVEIGNAPSEPTSQNGVEGHLTRLACSLELRDSDGKIIELTDRAKRQVSSLQETKNDFSRSPLRDYFMLFWFAAPSRPGQYSVKFSVRDPVGGREVSRRVPFRVQ